MTDTATPAGRAGPPRRQALHLRLGRGQGRGRRLDARPARRQGRGPRRDDQRGPARPARLHDHDRGLQRLLLGGREAPGRPVGRRARGGQGGRDADRQGVRQRRRPAPCQRPLGGEVLDARDDGHGPQPGPERGDAPRAGRPDRQRALRLGRLPAVHPDVRPDRDGREGRALRPRARGGQGAPTAPRRTPTSRAADLRRPSPRSSRRSSRPTPAATSRATRTSSSTSPSRPSSPAGSASAPSTTATTRRSPTTWARRSTS